MLIWRKGVRLLVLGTTSATIVACETAPSAAAPVPLEVWRGGDDGLTLRFADALEASFRRFPAFVLSSGKRPGTLVETIPSNVGWKQVGSRTKVIYSVEFTGTAAQPLVEPLVRSLHQQVIVQRPQHRPEPIGIIEGPGAAVVGGPKAIGEDLPVSRRQALKNASRMLLLEFQQDLPLQVQHLDLASVGD